MLKKLLKYDLKKMYKFLVIFYSLSLVFAVFTRIFLNINNSFIMDIVGSFCNGFTISMIVSILINNIIRAWVKFKNTLYDDESYLTHTLPVTKKQLYLSKIIVSVITMFTSILVIALTLFIAYYSKSNIDVLKSFLLPFATLYNSSVMGIIILLLVVFLVEFLNIVQVGFTGIILGHRMNNARVAFSVLYGFLTYVGSQLILVLCAFLISLSNKDLLNLFITNEVANVEILKVFAIVCIVIYLVIFIINLFVNIKLFNKGVNVE